MSGLAIAMHYRDRHTIPVQYDRCGNGLATRHAIHLCSYQRRSYHALLQNNATYYNLFYIMKKSPVIYSDILLLF
jgi:hypothetical protein